MSYADTHIGAETKWPQFRRRPFQTHLLNETVRISNNIPMKLFPKGRINDISAMVQLMAWHKPGAKPLSEPMLIR